MRLIAAIEGDLDRMMAAELKAAEIAVTAGTRNAVDGLKEELRGQVRAAGMSERMAKTWQSRLFPSAQTSISAAAIVFSKAPLIVDAFDRGATIRAKNRRFLAVPTPEARRLRGPDGTRATPANWPADRLGPLRFVPAAGARRFALLVVDNVRARKGKRGGYARAGAAAQKRGTVATAVMFTLLPQVSLPKRLDVAGAATRWQGRLAGLIVQNWPD